MHKREQSISYESKDDSAETVEPLTDEEHSDVDEDEAERQDSKDCDNATTKSTNPSAYRKKMMT